MHCILEVHRNIKSIDRVSFFADLSTRQLAHELSFKRGIPSVVLVDCDPYGLEIMLVYKYGSLSMAWSVETTAVPAMQVCSLVHK